LLVNYNLFLGIHMHVAEIRKTFLDFFANKNHQIIESSSLVPINDPTLLFANAGMNQFKEYFTGKIIPNNKRAVTVQKCVRAGGKHNDLENVGFTARHHTFFEMLGNFSFGDYFKSEAIAMAWEYLTVVLKIPKDRLYITVHDSDDEAMNIWHQEQGIPLDRIFKRGDKDNFWEMGDTGPCGPCSEIFYDHGEQYSDGLDHSTLLDDENRYVEIWNLVFMQFEKTANGTIKLPKPSVDTGSGLERLAAVMQNVYWNYDTDAFTPIIKATEALCNKSYAKDISFQSDFRVIADHVRSATMLITDGVIPSNEGRGYVLRSIIRRAIRHLDHLGIQEPALYKLVDSVFISFSAQYPENEKNKSLAKTLIELEENKFRETLNNGEKILNEYLDTIRNTNAKVFSAEVAFKLYDTYGYPIDLTRIICKEHGLQLDEIKFAELMQIQKENSKKAGQFKANDDELKDFYKIKQDYGDTEFLGYAHSSSNSKLIAKGTNNGRTWLVFDKTPFYAESGGQIGDSGTVITQQSAKINIIDTQKPIEHIFIHITDQDCSFIEVGTILNLEVDTKRRAYISKNHSATHLLQAALIEVLGDHVKQAGSMVTEERLRFDFTHPKALTKDEINMVEKQVNAKIRESLNVFDEVMSKDQATSLGAMALFGEKYSNEVRTIKMGEFSFELCGGIHVNNTAEISLFKIISEASLASGVRRIEAITNDLAFDYLEQRSEIVSQLERLFNCGEANLLQKITHQTDELKRAQKELKQLQLAFQKQNSQGALNNIESSKNGIKYTIAKVDIASAGELRPISDEYINQNPENLLLIFNSSEDKCNFLIRTGKNNTKINLSTLTKQLLQDNNARGGGKPDMIQGSIDIKSLDNFLNQFKLIISEIK
jgi:alanyl-tRNA synthetase